MKHKDEIIRWTNCPDGTMVWQKIGDNWYRINNPDWRPNNVYIVDDEEAEKRKLEPNNVYIVDDEEAEKRKLEYDTPVYEWQWLVWFESEKRWILTEIHYTDVETARRYVSKDGTNFQKFEPSKREVYR